MVWNKTVSGRLESRLNFGITTTYNNFPFPNLSDDQSLDIGRAGRAVLEARSEFPRSSLADLYDLDSMPSGLRKAHQSLDREIMKAMEMKPSLSEPEILKELFMRYEAAIKGLI
jgi:hypothetical protein